MQKNWLNQKLSFWQYSSLLVLSLMYYLLSVLPHARFGAWIADVFSEVSRTYYDNFVMICIAIFATFGILFLAIQARKLSSISWTGIAYIVITTLLMLAAFKLLIIVNIEAIHFLQYGIMATLLMYIFNRYDISIWTILWLACIDEGYQYWHLAPDKTSYFDFNDVVLDLLGGGMALSILFFLGKQSSTLQRFHRIWLTSIYVPSLIWLGYLFISERMGITPTAQHDYQYVLMKEIPDGFWSVDRKVNKFHILRPWTGLIISVALCLFYASLDRWSSKASK